MKFDRKQANMPYGVQTKDKTRHGPSNVPSFTDTLGTGSRTVNTAKAPA